MKINNDSQAKQNRFSDKPWLTADGKLRSDDELKKVAVNWSPSTWEAYMAATGMGDSAERDEHHEVLIGDHIANEKFSSDNALQAWLSDIENFPKLTRNLKKSIHKLPPRQQEVVRLYFWDGFTLTEISEFLKITPQSVFVLLNRAVERMRSEILHGISSHAPAVKTPRDKSACLKTELPKRMSSTA